MRKLWVILAVLALLVVPAAAYDIAAPLDQDAVGDYRYKILWEPEVAATGNVHFDIEIQRCMAVMAEECTDWQQVPQGHFTVTMNGDLIYEIANGPGTVAQRRGGVHALIEGDSRFVGVVKSDRAQRALISLMPGGEWPGVVTRGLVVE